MNNTKVIDTDVIRDIVLNAQKAVSDVLASTDDIDEVAFFENAHNELLTHFENIGMAADMAGLKGLHNACVQYSVQLTELPIFDSMDADAANQLIQTWLNNFLVYLDDWQSIENIEHIVSGLTSEADQIRIRLLHDIKLINSPTEDVNPVPDLVANKDDLTVHGDDFAIDSKLLEQSTDDGILNFDRDDIDNIYKTKVIDTDVIHDIVLNAQKAVSDVLAFTDDVDEVAFFENAHGELLAHFQNIGMFADMAGLRGLHNACVQYCVQLTNLPISNSMDADAASQLTHSWLNNFLVYLDDWQSLDNIEHIVSGLTSEADQIRIQLLQDIEVINSPTEDVIPVPDDSVASKDDLTVHGDDFAIDSKLLEQSTDDRILDFDRDDIDNIYKAKVIDTDVIRDIVLNAQKAVSDVLASTDDVDEVAFFENARAELLAHFQNIGMIADMAGLRGLNNACVQYCVQLTNLPISNSMDADAASQLTHSWLNNFLVYLDDWQSLDNIDHIVSGLTSEADQIRIQLLQDIEVINSPTEDVNPVPDSVANKDDLTVHGDDFAIDSKLLEQSTDDEVLDFDLDDIDNMLAVDYHDDDLSLGSPEGIMALLCHELVELQPKISELTQQLMSGDESVTSDAAFAYEEIISRIHNTCDGLGLLGLVQVCELISKNIKLAIYFKPESQSKMGDVLQGWPQVIIDHLESPTDDKLCLAVVDYLENESWLEPLQYSEIRELIDGLTRQLELTGDYEVEARSIEAQADDVSLDIASDASQQLMDAFFAESPTYAEELTKCIANVVNNIDVKENTKAAQRISHSLKGSANLIACKGIANFAHHLEDIFEYLAKQAFPPPEPLAFTMQEAADTIEVMIESLQGLSLPPEDSQRILQDVLDWANRIDQGNLKPEADIVAEQSAAIVNIDDELNVSNAQISEFQNSKTEDTQAQIPETQAAVTPSHTQTEFLHVPRDTIDLIYNLIGETSISIAQIQEQLNRMNEHGVVVRSQEKTLQSRRFELENLVNIRGMAIKQKRQRAVDGNADFDSLEMDQYNEFYGATHSFIESVSDTREASHEVTANIMELEGLFQQQIRLNRSLQDLVVTTRMIAVKTISARLQRAMRQACRATEKQAELTIIGEDLLMDGDVLNQLTDPIMHMLRNAIDHGIESAVERFENGKTKAGQVTLKFYLEGSMIRVTCSDDGAGLNYARIREIAIKRNLTTSEEDINNTSLARLILNSGFSTREQATQISGRGVGMDVVYTNVLSLKGSMDIYDNQPCGTTFSIRLPITLLTSHSLLITSAHERYAIPTSSLEQILPPENGQFSFLNDELTFQLGEKVYVARSLEQLLGMSDHCDYKNRTVLLANFDNNDYAITVESIISSYDLVVKGLGRYVKNVPGIAGVSLLGNGKVVPVLDIMQLIDIHIHGKQQTIRPVHKEIMEQSQRPRILIVDDSLSVRKSLSQLVQDAGFEPFLARDGVEALEVLQKSKLNLVLTDLEMPRMTGLELATHIRSNQDNDKLPIMMITSRTMEKHKKQAERAGVNEYITKPFSEDDLISKIGEALNG